MNEPQPKFSADRLLTIDERQMRAYAEQFVNDPTFVADIDDARRLLSSPLHKTTARMVYILEICGASVPVETAPVAADCLASTDAALCAAAARVLSRLPQHAISDSLVKTVADTPVQTLKADWGGDGSPREVGTNEQLVRSVLESWTV